MISTFTVLLKRSSYGNRTHDSAVRGQRLNPLTNEPFVCVCRDDKKDITIEIRSMQAFF